VTPGSGNADYCIYAQEAAAAMASITLAPVIPVVLSMSTSSGIVTISWNAVEGRNYVLESVNNLTDMNWLPLLPPVLATGSTVTVTNDAFGVLPQRFYRVKLVD
jgi:hypothetical protein